MTLGSVLWTAGAIAVSGCSKSIDAFAAVFLATAVITTAATIALALRLHSVRLVVSRGVGARCCESGWAWAPRGSW